MLTYEKMPLWLQGRFIAWSAEREKWLKRAADAEDYYYNDKEETGTTYTQAQLEKIKNTVNITANTNYLHPIVNQKLAIIVRNKPSHRVISTDGRGKEIAFVLDKMKHSVMYNSKSLQQNEQAIKNMLITGMGALIVTEARITQPGSFGTTIRHVHHSNFLLDPNSHDISLDDMEGFWTDKEITVETAEVNYGEIVAAINATRDPNEQLTWQNFAAPSQSGSPSSTSMKVIESHSFGGVQYSGPIFDREYYDKVFTRAYYVTNPQNGETSMFFAENLPEDQAQVLLAGESKYEDGIWIRRRHFLGDWMIESVVLPCRTYPIKVSFFEWAGNPYRSYGMIHFTRGMQETIDKTIHLMILNGILTNNQGWRAPEGSIAPEDVTKWENQGNDPTVIKFYKPVVIDGKIFAPERDQPAGLGNFYPIVLQMMKEGIEYSSGINAIISGNAKEAGVDVFASLQQYQSAAMERIILSLSHVNQMQEALGSVVIDYMMSELQPGKYFPFFDDKGSLNEVNITLQLSQQIKESRWLVQAIPAEAMPTQRLSIATELFKIAQTTPDPNERMLFINKALELTDIRETDSLLEEVNQIRELQGQLQNMQEQLKRNSEIMKQFENKALNADYRAKLAEKLIDALTSVAEKKGELTSAMSGQIADIKQMAQENSQ